MSNPTNDRSDGPERTRTLAMIKPDAVARGLTGQILARAQKAGLNPVGLRMLHLSRAQAQAFYAVHKGRPFYDELVDFMTEGPIVALAFEAPDAVPLWRAVMGATDPAEAEPGTIRADLAESKGRNCSHGSDSDENAAAELGFFFAETDLV